MKKRKYYLRQTQKVAGKCMQNDLDIVEGNIEEDKVYWEKMGYEAIYFELKEVKTNALPIK